MVTPHSFFDLVETFPSSGCAICNLVKRDVNRYLNFVLYERVTKPDTQETFRAARGLCDQHGWQLPDYKGGVLGVAILYRACIAEVLQIIEESPASPDRGGIVRRLATNTDTQATALANQLDPVEPCPACALLQEREDEYQEIMAKYIAETRMEEGFRNSDGLCLRHFQGVLRQIKDGRERELLVSIQVGHFEALKDELEQFINQHDYRHLDEEMAGERDSWLRAIARLGGEKGVFGLRRGDRRRK
ncbi:MAG: hypothetical protein JXJ17_15890 [Anaerolineae bacterium]|nr:hypothetical protein [Anaerolineae bacterium]